MVESKRNSAKLLWVIGTAWLFDALDVALLSFVMPVIKESWQLTAGQLGAVSAITTLGIRPTTCAQSPGLCSYDLISVR
ncbi:hypothetical protein WP50_26575 [Lactiplantibacillus plantarum]|nr:hypothetical protein WP50_26575 [Lactiplantibacillus plantarum]